MKISEIKKAAKELNELLGIEPPIDVKLKTDVLLEKIKEAAELLEDGEDEDLSKSTQSILKQLSAPDEEENDEDKEDNVPAFDDLSVGEQIEEGDLDQLKTLVKAEDTFKELRRGIGIQKKADVLREKMRVAFKEEQTAPTDKKVEKKADKKEIKKAEERAKAKEKKNKENSPPATLTSVDITIQSNKAIIYLNWKNDETNIDKLLSIVKNKVQKNTVKNWISQWAKEKGFPKII